MKTPDGDREGARVATSAYGSAMPRPAGRDTTGRSIPVSETTTDTLRVLREQRDRASATFEEAIVKAHAEKTPITKIAAESGLSRQAIYDLLKRRSQV